jgi:hypothetical protein
MSQKMLDDLKGEIELHDPKVAVRISALILVIAARIASLDGDAVKASDLASTLRLDPESLGTLVATNPPEPVPVAEPVAEPAKAAPAPAPAPAAKA